MNAADSVSAVEAVYISDGTEQFVYFKQADMFVNGAEQQSLAEFHVDTLSVFTVFVSWAQEQELRDSKLSVLICKHTLTCHV